MSTDSNMDAKHVTKLLLMDAYRQNTKQDMNLALWRFYMVWVLGLTQELGEQAVFLGGYLIIIVIMP